MVRAEYSHDGRSTFDRFVQKGGWHLSSEGASHLFKNLALEAFQQRSETDGIGLLRRMQDALGGAKRIGAIRDYEETIRAEAWDSNGALLGDVRKRTRWIRTPNVVRLDKPADFSPEIPAR